MMSAKIRSLVVLALLGALLAGCATGAAPVTGFMFTDVKGPMSAPGNANPSQVGMSSCYSLFGMVAVGDASINAASRNGNISNIHHVDFQTLGIMGVFTKFTTVVYGQ